jgi:hypothetical protein
MTSATTSGMGRPLEEDFRIVGDDERNSKRDGLVNLFNGAPHECIGQENCKIRGRDYLYSNQNMTCEGMKPRENPTWGRSLSGESLTHDGKAKPARKSPERGRFFQEEGRYYLA